MSADASRPLPDGHLEAVCRIGQGEKCCAYLAMGGPVEDLPGWTCAKDMPTIRAAIALRLAAGTMTAKGDNCSGPPDFESVAS